MPKPILYADSAYAFDAVNGKTFRYQWANTNSQSVGNILVIRNNSTNEIVYQETISTLQLKHDLPGSILTNGVAYNVRIAITCADDTTSEYSDPVLFSCFSTPSFYTTVIQNQVVENSSYSVGISYSQMEDEELQCFTLYLYDSNQNIIQSSPTIYDVEDTYTFTRLEDNTSYYISAKGQTINHMDIESSMVYFTVDYRIPSYYSYVVAENRKDYGDIQISSNLISIEGSCAGIPVYIESSYIDTVNGPRVWFDHGFDIDSDFMIEFRAYGFSQNDQILRLSNQKSGCVTLTYRKGIFEINNDVEKSYIELMASNKSLNYYVFSNFITHDDEILKIKLKKKSNFYSIVIENEEETE